MSSKREYRAVYTVLRVDPAFLPLSKDAKLYWHTAKLELPVSGIGVCLIHTIAGLASLTVEEAKAAEQELAEAGWLQRNGAVLWIVNGLRHTPNLSPKDKNHRKHIAVLLADLPRDLPIVEEFRAYYAEWFTAPTEQTEEGADEGASEGAGEGPSDGPPEQGRRKKEEGTTTPPPPADADDAGHADRFTEPRHRDAYAGIRRAAQNPKGLDHELQLLADGGERPGSGTQSPYGWATVGEALHQLSVNGGRPTSRALQSFCAKVASAADDEAARERRTTQTGAKLTMMGRGVAGRADDGADVLAELRNRIERIEVPGHGINRVLRRERVEELGADVAAAVERIGGVRVITECTPDRYSFLVRDFSEALARARREAAA